jgi:hypothetical protein
MGAIDAAQEIIALFEPYNVIVPSMFSSSRKHHDAGTPDVHHHHQLIINNTHGDIC